MAVDAAVTTLRGGWSRTKVVVAVRATKKRSRRREGRMRVGVRSWRRRGER
jgi:hypothetical protein